jgi:polysaccharide biosynthesis/export protein
MGRVCAVVAAAWAVGACQPTLKSNLPAGPAAYEAIDPGLTTAANGPYLLARGDKIAVNIYQEEELSQRDVLIDAAGRISLPLIGELQAEGLSSGELARQIEAAYGRSYLRNPEANVLLLEARPRTVSVEGQVRNAGVYRIEPGQTLLTALALAGSPTETAKLDEVLVFRMLGGQRFGGRFDVTEVRAGRMPDPQLMPGDVVVIGYDRARGIYRDVLQVMPGVMGAFVALTNNN